MQFDARTMMPRPRYSFMCWRSAPRADTPSVGITHRLHGPWPEFFFASALRHTVFALHVRAERGHRVVEFSPFQVYAEVIVTHGMLSDPPIGKSATTPRWRETESPNTMLLVAC